MGHRLRLQRVFQNPWGWPELRERSAMANGKPWSNSRYSRNWNDPRMSWKFDRSKGEAQLATGDWWLVIGDCPYASYAFIVYWSTDNLDGHWNQWRQILNWKTVTKVCSEAASRFLCHGMHPYGVANRDRQQKIYPLDGSSPWDYINHGSGVLKQICLSVQQV